MLEKNLGKKERRNKKFDSTTERGSLHDLQIVKTYQRQNKFHIIWVIHRIGK